MGSRSTNKTTSQQSVIGKDARVTKRSTPSTLLRRATTDSAGDLDGTLSSIFTAHRPAKREREAGSPLSLQPVRRATDSVLDVKRDAHSPGLVAQSEQDSVSVTDSASTNATEWTAFVFGQPEGRDRGLCPVCAAIPSSIFFPPSPSEPQIRHRLPRVDPQRSCPFCRFVARVAAQICENFATQHSWEYIRHRKSASLVSISPDQPWYEMAGINSDLPPAPCAWLQFGTFDDQAPIEPYICVSLSGPKVVSQLGPRMAYSQPRERATGREAAGLLDYGLIRSWMQICTERHTELCSEGMVFKRGFLALKLMDVRRRTIVHDNGHLPYAALSYVWGSAEPGAATRESKLSTDELLQRPLPQTIEDAIVATGELGLNYIWIDRFCIDQHDAVDVAEQIANMDLVYECAEITLVALAGAKIDHGLPGVSRPLEHTVQPVLETDGYRFVATYVDSMWDCQGTKPWDQRGWTLQEGILSTRCLFFDKSHVYMRCRQELFHDTIMVDVSTAHVATDQSSSYFWENGFSLDVRQPVWTFTVYDSLIANYTGRELTVQADALSACKGALNQITRNTGVGFVWGLPQIDFCKALLWSAWHGNCITRRDGFPSWSWTGWKGRTEYGYWLDEHDSYRDQMEERWRDHAAESTVALHRRRQLRSIQEEEAFAQTKGLYEGPDGQVLKISSTLTPFHGKFVRKQGRPRRLEAGSQQSRFAVGDHWTLTDGKGKKEGKILENAVGDHMNFETMDHFFQLHPSCSALLRTDMGKAQLLFIKYWPAIRDHHQSEKWLYDIVSALVILRDDERPALRLACVHMHLADWLAADPQPSVVELV